MQTLPSFSPEFSFDSAPTVMIFLIAAVVAFIVGIIIISVVNAKNDKASRTPESSYFDGNIFQLVGLGIVAVIVTVITLSIAFPWMLCMIQKWRTKHTVIHGRRLKFTGKGHQLIGRYILWAFLTVITLGIYSIWFGLGVKKWVVKHTVYADGYNPVDSYFSGGAGGYLGMHILAFMLTVFTLGIAKAWADTMLLRWEAKHTHIGGSPLEFNGSGGALFVRYLFFAPLSVITVGVYAFCFPVRITKWQIRNTEAVYKTAPIQTKARAHEFTAMQDFAKYRIAANDGEIAAMKSGYTGKEDAEALEKMAAENNPFAAYQLAKLTKGENEIYEGRALELLHIAANGKNHFALCDLAKQLPATEALPMFIEAAQCGNADASWHLAVEYKKANDLANSAYWFKVASEWGIPEACEHTDQYDRLINDIALQLSESRPMPKQSKALPIILGIFGALILLGGAAVVLLLMPARGYTEIKRPAEAIQYFEFDSVDASDVRGENYVIDDSYGFAIDYTIDEEVFFDTDRQILYLNFGLNEYKSYVQLRDEKGWHTVPVYSGTGFTQISYPYRTGPAYVEIWSDVTAGYHIECHYLQVTEGDSYEAEEWLEEKYGDDATDIPEDTTEYVETEGIISDSLIGEWKCYDMVTNIHTGDNELQIWTYQFNADGTCSISHGEYLETDDAGYEYYYGSYWMCVLGQGGDGSYEINGNQITAYLVYPQSSEPMVQYYTYEFESGNLCIVGSDGIPRTCEKVN